MLMNIGNNNSEKSKEIKEEMLGSGYALVNHLQLEYQFSKLIKDIYLFLTVI